MTRTVADNGQIALDLIYKAERDAEMGTVGGRRYDVILMDLEMPGELRLPEFMITGLEADALS